MKEYARGKSKKKEHMMVCTIRCLLQKDKWEKVKIPNYYPMDNKEASYETSCDAMMKHLSPSIYMWYWQAWLNHQSS